MSGDFLRIQFVDHRDGIGELIAHVSSRSFSGNARAYINVDAVEHFANMIAVFELANEPHTIIAGRRVGADDRPGEPDQEHFGITVYPVDSRGYIGLQVRMATPICVGGRSESQEPAKVELLTTHKPLARFSRDLLSVIGGEADEAVLTGSL